MVLEVKGVDLGGVFHFVRNKPSDTAHTKEKKLWMIRFKNGMCPHCGIKCFKVKRFRLVPKYVPLNIKEKVDNGVCIHPKCDPPKKTRPKLPEAVDVTINTGSVDATIGTDVDTMLDAIEEQRADMVKFYKDMQDSNAQTREEASLMLEDAVMQINRSMAELSEREKSELQRVKKDLLGEIEVAQEALGSLKNKVDYMAEVMTTVKRQVHSLREASQKNWDALRAEVEALRAGLAEVRSFSDQQNNDALRTRVDAFSTSLYTWQKENESLRQENKLLRARLEDSLRERESPIKQVAELKSGDSGHKQAATPPRSRLDELGESYKFKTFQSLTASSGIMCCAVIGSGQRIASASASTLCIYWKNQVDKTYAVKQELNRHKSLISCIATAKDAARTLVSGSDDCTLMVWHQNNHTGAYEQKETLRQHSGKVFCCSISHDGLTLVSGCSDGSTILWKRQPGGSFEVHQRLGGQDSVQGGVECCAMTGDGKILLTGSSDKSLRVWKRRSDDQSYVCDQILYGHNESVLCCAIDEGAMTVVSGGKDSNLIVWMLQPDGKYNHFQTLNKHTEWVQCCILCNGGKMLVSGSDDDSLIVWTRQPDGKFKDCQAKKHNSDVYCCAALGAGETLVSGGMDGILKLWALKRL